MPFTTAAGSEYLSFYSGFILYLFTWGVCVFNQTVRQNSSLQYIKAHIPWINSQQFYENTDIQESWQHSVRMNDSYSVGVKWDFWSEKFAAVLKMPGLKRHRVEKTSKSGATFSFCGSHEPEKAGKHDCRVSRLTYLSAKIFNLCRSAPLAYLPLRSQEKAPILNIRQNGFNCAHNLGNQWAFFDKMLDISLFVSFSFLFSTTTKTTCDKNGVREREFLPGIC